jgi:hypothetical protein
VRGPCSTKVVGSVAVPELLSVTAPPIADPPSKNCTDPVGIIPVGLTIANRLPGAVAMNSLLFAGSSTLGLPLVIVTVKGAESDGLKLASPR